MGRILLIIAVVVAVIVVAGPLLGLLLGMLKWALILGALLLGAVGLSKLLSSRNKRH